jgi:hypothetical protein
MEYAYWVVILMIELVVARYGIRWVCKATTESYGPLQPGSAMIYALGVAAVMIGIAALAYFLAFDFLGFKIPLISRR